MPNRLDKEKRRDFILRTYDKSPDTTTRQMQTLLRAKFGSGIDNQLLASIRDGKPSRKGRKEQPIPSLQPLQEISFGGSIPKRTDLNNPGIAYFRQLEIDRLKFPGRLLIGAGCALVLFALFFFGAVLK